MKLQEPRLFNGDRLSTEGYVDARVRDAFKIAESDFSVSDATPVQGEDGTYTYAHAGYCVLVSDGTAKIPFEQVYSEATDSTVVTLALEQSKTYHAFFFLQPSAGGHQEESDYIPMAQKAAPGGVPELDAKGKVPAGQLPVAGDSAAKRGVVYVFASYGITRSAEGLIMVNKANATQIDARQNNYTPIVPSNLDYAVRSVVPNITTIPAATTAYTLLDATATTNSHSCIYIHAPSSAPTYTLPAVTDATVSHSITLSVLFSASVITYSFEDSSGTPIIPSPEIVPEAGQLISFICEWSSLQNRWIIKAVDMGANE